MKKLLLALILVFALPCTAIGQDDLYVSSNSNQKSKGDVLKKMVVFKKDNFENTTTYTHRAPYNNSANTPITAFITKDDKYKRISIGLRFSYTGNGWIFFENISFKFTESDNDPFLRIDAPRKTKTESVTYGSGVYESYLFIPSIRQLSLLKTAIDSETLLIRLDGGRGYHNEKVYKTYLKNVGEVINAYYELCEQTGYENLNGFKQE